MRILLLFALCLMLGATAAAQQQTPDENRVEFLHKGAPVSVFNRGETMQVRVMVHDAREDAAWPVVREYMFVAVEDGRQTQNRSDLFSANVTLAREGDAFVFQEDVRIPVWAQTGNVSGLGVMLYGIFSSVGSSDALALGAVNISSRLNVTAPASDEERIVPAVGAVVAASVVFAATAVLSLWYVRR